MAPDKPFRTVMAELDPTTSCRLGRDARVKPGHGGKTSEGHWRKPTSRSARAASAQRPERAPLLEGEVALRQREAELGRVADILDVEPRLLLRHRDEVPAPDRGKP